MNINEQPTERGSDRAAGATADISLVEQVEVTTRPSSAEKALDRKADQEDFDYRDRPGSPEDRLISLQARLAQLEQLNSRLKYLKNETQCQQKSRWQSLSSDADSDIFLQPRESATIHAVYDSSLVSAAGAGRTVLMQTEKTPIEERRYLQGDGKPAATGHRASFKIQPDDARGGPHSRDENFNPSTVHEDLASRKTSAIERDLEPENSRPTPFVHSNTLNAMKRNAESKHSSKSLNVNTRSAARFAAALHSSHFSPQWAHYSPQCANRNCRCLEN
jgi:hypothetical protein